jgi:tape measure domain-containing protein
MAKTVSDLILRLKTEGVAGLDKLKSSFRGLEKAIGPTDAQLVKIRQGLKEVAAGTNQSVQAIEGQIQAFKALQKQATVGSAVYTKLTKDIRDLTKSLADLETQYEDTAKKARSLAQQEGVFAAKTGDKITSQFAARRKMLAGLSVGSQEYATLLARQTIQEDAYTRALSRQRVIAAAARTTRLGIPGQGAMDMSVEAVRAYYMRGVGDLPNTTAALSLRLNELQGDLANVTRGGETYNIISREMSRVQRELNRDLDQNANSYDRIAAKLRLIQTQTTAAGSGFLAFSQRATAGAAITEAAVEKSIARARAKRAVYSFERPPVGDQIQPTRSAVELMRVGAQGRAARPPLGARGYAQVAGAAISGGIFGGPEGFLGGVAGGALGGVGGAFAGAAAGAQISALRQQLAGTADYAAQISKLQIALRGVAGSQAEYTRAVQAAADVTRTLNVPQEVAVAGMTKLSAAVKGAGGNVSDAELVFKNVTSAIKATGGGAEDVQGAITAMVQVFSKGKVSAEELSGQLGERLPGAVTMFAEANKMSLPELQEALKKGEVGLNELMNFVEALGVRFSGTAQTIASSSADAGARLTVAFNAMRLEVGKALQPIGAEFQAAFAKFITDITPAAVEAAKKVGEGLKFIIDNAGKIAAIAKFAATFALVNAALKVFAALSGPVNTAFLLIQARMVGMSQQAEVARLRTLALVGSIRAAALAASVPIILTVGIIGVQVVIDALNKIQAAKDRLQSAKTGPRGEEWVRSIGGTAAETGMLQGQVKAAKETSDYLSRKITTAQTQIAELEKSDAPSALTRAQALRETMAIDIAQRAQAQSRYGAGQAELRRRAQQGPTRTDFGSPTGDGAAKDGAGGKGAVKMLQEELNLRDRIRAAQLKGNELEELLAQYLLDAYQAGLETEDVLKRQNDLNEAATRFELGLVKFREDKAKKDEDELKKKEELLQKEKELKFELTDRAYKLGLINEKDYNSILLLRERQRLEREYKGVPGAEGFINTGVELYRQEIDPTPFEEMRQNIAKLKVEMAELLNPVNQIVGAAGAIGTAFSNSFTSVINGSATTQEALASFFQNVGKFFLDMAGKIIAQMITMAILNSVVGLLPGAGATKAASTGLPAGAKGLKWDQGLLDFVPIPKNAKGNVFNKGIQAYAMGGIVNRPTMFAYADGGTGRFGLMGEAGPEAIIPLKRGPDGKLGVSGGGGNVQVGSINISVENKGENLDPAAQKRLANQVQGIVLATLVNQKRSGGVL